MNKRQLREEILKRVELPRIPQREAAASQFGAKPGTGELQTSCLQRAIDETAKAGGGRVTVAAGIYRTGALRLQSGVELHLEEGAILSFVSEEPEANYPLVLCHWEGTPCYNYSPLLYACDAHDIAVTGRGILDGGADRGHWWNWHHQVEEAWSSDDPDRQLKDRMELRRMNQEGVPVEERIFGPGHFLRPNFIQPFRCERVLLADFTVNNSPMWQLNPVMCKSVTVERVTMASHGPNNDGCDPESCNGVVIRGCRFDTGDDCISLKSGRDRDGRLAAVPCQNVLIEDNEFADGHGGVALGSEMSGGIRRVLAVGNRFDSPNLTYALRLKTNAKRGGRVEDIILADSVMGHVHGAAVHGTMLYEDGRNGDNLPVFRNITVENIKAHGGDYGIFLEAFREVPITGLVLRDIEIDGVERPLRSMNWQDPVVENVVINGLRFPRPFGVRILGVPVLGGEVRAAAEICGGTGTCVFYWESCEAGADPECGESWREAGDGERLTVPDGAAFLRLTAVDRDGNEERSRVYRVLRERAACESEDMAGYERQRLACRGLLDEGEIPGNEPATRDALARMTLRLADGAACRERDCLREAIVRGLLAPDNGSENPEGHVTRQEMATVAMQACGVNYRNASSTMPVCADVDQVTNNYGTNVSRALYFGFMRLEPDGRFEPERPVSAGEAAGILNRVADFAGI